jgi:Asp-tRNA(Asn)/Glu-tRNA(Gln) amidotransferase C subunit
MPTRPQTQTPVIRALFQSKISEKPIIGGRTPRRDIPVSPRIASLLEAPTWSVRSLLPDPDRAIPSEDIITKSQLHHLLRLSALPPPRNEKEESKLLKTLQAQIHFVKEIQKVDTSGVEPLRAIRDETTAAVEEETVTLEDLKLYLDKEEKVGRNGKVRRRRDRDDHGGDNAHTWDPFGMSTAQSRRYGKYFVVRRSKTVTS